MSPIPASKQTLDVFVNQEDPFDGSAEPTVYMSENRMPVMIEFSNILIYIIFSALLLALLLILPGIRKTKITSLLGLLTLLTVCASILLALSGSSWLTGSVSIQEGQYSALTSETISGKLQINIGLSWANVSLTGRLMGLDTNKPFSYNERFSWSNPDRMLEEHTEALRKGLPYPILTVSDFLSQDNEGFNWARQLRQAGYYTSMALYLSLASWTLTALFMCLLPVYLPHMLQITGTLMMASVWLYTLLIQSPEFYSIQVAGRGLELAFGSSYVTTFVSGALSMVSGIILMIVQMSNEHKPLTIMDSEGFTNDQKALYKLNLGVKELTSGSMKKGGVIIPMGDIEENFHGIVKGKK